MELQINITGEGSREAIAAALREMAQQIEQEKGKVKLLQAGPALAEIEYVTD
jgi:hypothetical protein